MKQSKRFMVLLAGVFCSVGFAARAQQMVGEQTFSAQVAGIVNLCQCSALPSEEVAKNPNCAPLRAQGGMESSAPGAHQALR